MAANVFVGQTEAPLVVKPYIPEMTLSEMNAMMTGGFATIAGSVLAVYVGFIGEEYGPHLLTASVMSAPAAFVIAKIMRPEVETPVTGSDVPLKVERSASNLIEAAANGTTDGLKLWLNVIAMLVAFIALVNLVDWPLGYVGHEWFGMPVDGEPGSLDLNLIFGRVFAPIAWQFVLRDYQKDRILTLLDSEADELGTGWHARQSRGVPTNRRTPLPSTGTA